MHNLKLKVYPLLIAAIGVIAASGGYFREPLSPKILACI